LLAGGDIKNSVSSLYFQTPPQEMIIMIAERGKRQWPQPGGNPRDLRLLERPTGYLLTGDWIANGINRWLARRGWGKFFACH